MVSRWTVALKSVTWTGKLLHWSVRGKYRRRGVISLSVLIGIGVGVAEVWEFDRALAIAMELIFGVPVPGRPLAPSTWMAPTNGLWPEFMPLSFGMGVVSVLLVSIPLVQVARATDPRARWQAIRRGIYAMVMIATTWTVLPIGLHLVDQLAFGLSPAPSLVTKTRAFPARGLLATVLGAGVVIIRAVAIVTSLLAMLVLHALVMVGFVVWPLAWTLRIVTDGTLASVGRTVTALMSIGVVTKLIEALLAFVILHIDWTAGLAETVAVVIGVGMFVYLPIAMLQNAERLLRLMWIAPQTDQVGRYIEESVERMDQTHEQAQEWHEERTTPTQSTLDEWNSTPSVSRWRRWIPQQSSVFS